MVLLVTILVINLVDMLKGVRSYYVDKTRAGVLFVLSWISAGGPRCIKGIGRSSCSVCTSGSPLPILSSHLSSVNTPSSGSEGGPSPGSGGPCLCSTLR